MSTYGTQTQRQCEINPLYLFTFHPKGANYARACQPADNAVLTVPEWCRQLAGSGHSGQVSLILDLHQWSSKQIIYHSVFTASCSNGCFLFWRGRANTQGVWSLTWGRCQISRTPETQWFNIFFAPSYNSSLYAVTSFHQRGRQFPQLFWAAVTMVQVSRLAQWVRLLTLVWKTRVQILVSTMRTLSVF